MDTPVWLIKVDWPYVDLESNMLVQDGRRTELSPQMALILDALIRRAPRAVHKDSLIGMLWSGDEPQDAENVLAVQISNMRKRLVGCRIENIWGVGYRFVEAA